MREETYRIWLSLAVHDFIFGERHGRDEIHSRYLVPGRHGDFSASSTSLTLLQTLHSLSFIALTDCA